MQFSKFQQAIFDWIKNGIGNGIIQAVAGSGKTTTITEALKLVSGKTLFLAFSKKITENLKVKIEKMGLSATADSKTLHQSGLALLRIANPKLNVVLDKMDKIINSYPPLIVGYGYTQAEKAIVYEDRKIVTEMVKKIKNTLCDYNDLTALYDLADYYDIDLTDKQVPYIKYVIEKSIAQGKYTIDFDDMIYMPVILKLSPRKRYDWIFVDETQDLNTVQIELVLQLVSATGRVICVGDKFQSIYGFRGASVDAMERIQKALNAKEMPLSICYRCPKTHIAMAQKIVPQIEATENAIEGTIENIQEDDFFDKLTAENSLEVLTLSRTNAILVKYALKLISQGKKATIQGRDIGKGLISLVRKQNAVSVSDLMDKIYVWRNKEIDKLTKRNASESIINVIEDKVETISYVIDDCDTVACVISKLENIFKNDEINGYIFSSVHQAKGLEAKIVYILAPEKLPLVWKNQQAWEAEQEQNIKYVAVTRSKNKLVFVISKDK